MNILETCSFTLTFYRWINHKIGTSHKVKMHSSSCKAPFATYLDQFVDEFVDHVADVKPTLYFVGHAISVVVRTLASNEILRTLLVIVVAVILVAKNKDKEIANKDKDDFAKNITTYIAGRLSGSSSYSIRNVGGIFPTRLMRF